METKQNQFQKLENDMFHYGFQHLVFAAHEFSHKQKKIVNEETGAERFEHEVTLKHEFTKKILKAVGEGLSSPLFWEMFMENTFDELREQVGTNDCTGADLREKFHKIIMPLVSTLLSSHERLVGYGADEEIGGVICMMEELRLLDEMQVFLETRRKNILGFYNANRKKIQESFTTVQNALMEAPVQVTV